jgi:hypothetical protein
MIASEWNGREGAGKEPSRAEQKGMAGASRACSKQGLPAPAGRPTSQTRGEAGGPSSCARSHPARGRRAECPPQPPIPGRPRYIVRRVGGWSGATEQRVVASQPRKRNLNHAQGDVIELQAGIRTPQAMQLECRRPARGACAIPAKALTKHREKASSKTSKETAAHIHIGQETAAPQNRTKTPPAQRQIPSAAAPVAGCRNSRSAYAHRRKGHRYGVVGCPPHVRGPCDLLRGAEDAAVATACPEGRQ